MSWWHHYNVVFLDMGPQCWQSDHWLQESHWCRDVCTIPPKRIPLGKRKFWQDNKVLGPWEIYAGVWNCPWSKWNSMHSISSWGRSTLQWSTRLTQGERGGREKEGREEGEGGGGGEIRKRKKGRGREGHKGVGSEIGTNSLLRRLLLLLFLKGSKKSDSVYISFVAYPQVYGWEPVVTHDSQQIHWGKVADMAISGEQLVRWVAASIACKTPIMDMLSILHRLVHLLPKLMSAYGVWMWRYVFVSFTIVVSFVCLL